MTALAVHAEPLVRWRDNPIALAQFRRRMRPKQAVPTLLVVGILGVCGVAWSIVLADDTGGRVQVRNLLFGLLSLTLWIGGATQASAMVADDKKSRLLDFHRATPTTPWTDCLGYLLGSPAREYACAAVLVPFVLAATALAGASIPLVLAALCIVVFSGWLYHTLGLLMGLTARDGRARQATIGALVVLGLSASWFRSTGVAWLAHLTPLPALASLDILGSARVFFGDDVDFFGLALPAPLYTFLLQGNLLAFLYAAVARKLHREGAHAFSRTGALAFFALTLLLSVGPAWSSITTHGRLGIAIAAYVALSLIIACGLAASLVPTYLEHVRALRRSSRLGRRPGWLEQGAASWPLVPALLGLFVAGMALVAACATHTGLASWSVLFARSEVALVIASAASLLALIVGVLEHNRLRMRRAAKSGTFLVVFLVFVLPWIVGMILSMGGLRGDLVGYVFALSPVFAAGGSTLLLAVRWGLEKDPGLVLGQLFFSVAMTAGLATWFAVRAASTRRRIVAQDAGSNPGSAVAPPGPPAAGTDVTSPRR